MHGGPDVRGEVQAFIVVVVFYNGLQPRLEDGDDAVFQAVDFILVKLDFETLNLEIPKYQGVEGDINRRTTTLLPIQERVLD